MSGRTFTVADAIEYADSRPRPHAWVARETVPRYGVKLEHRAVLLCLWDHAYWEPRTRRVLSDWSQSQIAREVGCSTRMVGYALDTLDALGMIGDHNREPGKPVVFWLAVERPARVRYA